MVMMPFRGRLMMVFEEISVDFRKQISDVFYALAVPLKNCGAFRESMNKLSQPVLLTENNQHSHEERGKNDVRRFCKIVEFPDILILQLARSDYNNQNFRRCKISDEFEFMEQICTSEYFERQDKYYHLHAVVTHSETTEHCHYGSIISLNDSWYRFRDMDFEKIPDSTFKHLVFGSSQAESGMKAGICGQLSFYHAEAFYSP
jgi:ubiquitin C-terminal hydrolase